MLCEKELIEEIIDKILKIFNKRTLKYLNKSNLI